MEAMKAVLRSFFTFVLAAGLCFAAASARAAPPVPFEEWLAQARLDAVEKEGISPELAERALTGLSPVEKIVQLDRAQPEFTQSFADYSATRVNEARIMAGRAAMEKHGAALRKAGEQFGVAPQYIAALWGMETNYGGFTGGYNVIEALATLAWNGRGGERPDRAAYFRKEMMTALKIVDEGHVSLADMKGSWAGAMGQVQFMPSSFQRLAVDGDGDGHKNIWTDYEDAFASAANYLARNGWKDGDRWGRRVYVPPGFKGGTEARSLAAWSAAGVRRADGGALPEAPAGMTAKLVTPDGASGPAYLVYGNFGVIKSWNNSDKFALSVGLLADAIAAGTTQ